MKTASILLVLALTAGVAAADVQVTNVNANCSSPRTFAWVPLDEDLGEISTVIATWRNPNRTVIGAVDCDGFAIGSWVADLRGSLQMTNGSAGELCAVAFCTLGGATKLQVNLAVGFENPNFSRASAAAGPDGVPPGTLFRVDAADFPELSSRLSRLQERASSR